jgi:predicted acylesterase/phospholipase RssA
MKGMIPAMVQAEIESRLQAPLSSVIDLFAGTSIGGIMACLLASGHSASQVVRFFTDDGPNIFGKQASLGRAGFMRPRYSNKPIEAVLQDKLGSLTMNTCKVPVVITAMDLNSRQPVIFESGAKADQLLWDVARATSAAQTYFQPHPLRDWLLWDGGNVVNDPSMCAYVHACRLWWPGDTIHVVSLGCGAAPVRPRRLSANPYRWGLLPSAAMMLQMTLDTPSALVANQTNEMLGASESYTRIELVDDMMTGLAIDGARDPDIAKLRAAGAECIRRNDSTISALVAFLKTRLDAPAGS